MLVFVFAVYSPNTFAQRGEPARGCEAMRSVAGFGVGVVVGTILLPGLGTVLAGLLAGGGTCIYDAFWGSATPVAGDGTRVAGRHP